MDDILAIAREKGEKPLIVVCDELSDPHNLGAVIRTADAAGAHGVIIPKRRSVGLTWAVGKASAGAVEHLPVARVGNLASTLEELKALCGRGEINAAENLLFEELDFSDPGTLPIALAFYEHLNRFSDQELEARDYSREEIFEGVKDCAEQYGVDPQLLEAFRP